MHQKATKLAKGAQSKRIQSWHPTVLKPGTFVGRASWGEALKAAGLKWTISSGGGQTTDQLNIYDQLKKKPLGFVPINGSLIIQPDTQKYALTWECPIDEEGLQDLDARMKQKLTITKIK